MVSREDKIQYLETQIENEKLAGSDGANCVSIARKQIELSRLYRANGNVQKSDDVLNDTLKTLEDPMCIRTNETTRLITAIRNFQSNPNMMNMQKMPALYRYIGLIILLVGYGAIYLTSQYITLPSDYFLVGILVVFVLSMWIGSALRRRYIRSLRNNQSNTIEGNNDSQFKNP